MPLLSERTVVAAVLFAAFLLANFALARRIRRLPGPGAATPENEPAIPASPLRAAYIWNRVPAAWFEQPAVTRALVCAIVDLAVRGFISIRRDGVFTVTLARRDPVPGRPPREEAALLNLLLPPDGSPELTLALGPPQPRLATAQSELIVPIVGELGRRHFRTNALTYAGEILMALVIAQVAVPVQDGVDDLALSFSALWTFGLLLMFQFVRFSTSSRRPPARNGLGVLIMIFVALSAMVAGLALAVSLIGKVGFLAVGIALAAPTLAVFSNIWLEPLTPTGERAIERLTEYREALLHGSPPAGPWSLPPGVSRFEWELPYAHALGIADGWASRCSGEPVGETVWCFDRGVPVTDPEQIAQIVSGSLERAVQFALTARSEGMYFNRR